MTAPLANVRENSDWKWLYRVAGVSALLSGALILVAGAVFVMWPPPGFSPSSDNVRDWFALFQAHKLVGLFDLDLVMVADNVLFIPLILALYVILRRTSQSFMTLGTGVALVGAAGYFAINPAFSMLALSDQYSAAASDAERSALLAAGTSLLGVYQGTGFDAYLLLVSAAGVIVSAVMLRQTIFGRATAIAGILANGLTVGMFLPAVGLYLGFISLLPLLVWYFLVGRKLLQLGQGLPLKADRSERLVAEEVIAPIPIHQP